jgi:hypothetical protein
MRRRSRSRPHEVQARFQLHQSENQHVRASLPQAGAPEIDRPERPSQDSDQGEAGRLNSRRRETAPKPLRRIRDVANSPFARAYLLSELVINDQIWFELEPPYGVQFLKLQLNSQEVGKRTLNEGSKA